MDIFVEDVINFPRDQVFETYRDKLPEMVKFLPNIDKIEILEREENDGTTRLLNLWKAKASEIPKLLAPFVKPEMMQWKDHAKWDNEGWTCEWRSELGFFSEQIEVKGKNTYEPQGDNSVKITIRGTITVDGKKLPGVPRLVAGKVGSTVEKFVVKMITPNLRELNRGCEQYLKSQA